MKIKLEFGEAPDRDAEIIIECDLEDLQVFRHSLDQLIEGKTDHSHFFSSKWGGYDIQPTEGNDVGGVHHIKILRVP